MFGVNPKFLHVVQDAKLAKPSPKRKKRLIAFWKRLSCDQMSALYRQFVSGIVATTAESGGPSRQLQNQDSLDAASGSILSSSAIDNSLSEVGASVSLPGAANIVLLEDQRPKHSLTQSEWVAAVCHVCSSQKMANDAASVFK